MTYEQAVDRVRDQMAAMKAGDPARTVGEMMTQLLAARPEAAARISGDKSLKMAYGAIRKAAEKRRKGESCICIAPDEAWEIVLGYYGIDGGAPEIGPTPPPAEAAFEGNIDPARLAEPAPPPPRPADAPAAAQTPAPMDDLLEGLL